jgi:hypothetical protein
VAARARMLGSMRRCQPSAQGRYKPRICPNAWAGARPLRDAESRGLRGAEGPGWSSEQSSSNPSGRSR